MSDRRLVAANGRVAYLPLQGVIEAERFTEGALMRVTVPVADLCRAPGGARDKQMLRGWGFRVLEIRDGWAFGFDVVDGYVGYLREAALGETAAPTHRVSVRGCHIYAEPDIKSPDLESLSFFAGVAVTAEADGFCALAGGGYVVTQHLEPLSWRAGDAASVAEMFLGVPYLWGGNTGLGIDCSGLVQLSYQAVGRACARDSDMQESDLGEAIGGNIALRRGDLLFWKGHVAMALDEARLIHATGHHMAVVTEPVDEVVRRVEAQGEGPVTGRRRV